MKTIKALAAIAVVLPTLAFAQANTPGIDQHQANQERRIDQGVASGSLTQREANRLERGQQRVDNMETGPRLTACLPARNARASIRHRTCKVTAFTARSMIVSMTIITMVARTAHASVDRRSPI